MRSRGLPLDEVNQLRDSPGRSVLLFITDRCPVECEHCSVSSLRDSPTISDYGDFSELVKEITRLDGLRMVGISGGEPFVERRGLELAVNEFESASLAIVAYTSGYWARKGSPRWVSDLLMRIDTLFISPDAYHVDRLGHDTLIRAVDSALSSGVSIVIQLVNSDGAEERARELLSSVDPTGDGYEINLVPLLAYGRSHFRSPRKVAQILPRCGATTSPVIRYDARAIACCNEGIIMGGGPQRLNTPFVAGSGSLKRVLNSYAEDAWLGAIATAGPAKMAQIPLLASAVEGATYRDTCDFCWRTQKSLDEASLARDPMLRALKLVNDLT